MLCTVIDTAIMTVIKVAHTRRGARSIVAAARAPGAPSRSCHRGCRPDDRTGEGETHSDITDSSQPDRRDREVSQGGGGDEGCRCDETDADDPRHHPGRTWHGVGSGRSDRRQRFDRRHLVHLAGRQRCRRHAHDNACSDPYGNCIAGEDVLGSRFVPLQQGRGKGADRLPADDHTEGCPHETADQPHQPGLHQEVAHDLPFVGADGAQHRDHRAALRDRHAHRVEDQKSSHDEGRQDAADSINVLMIDTAPPDWADRKLGSATMARPPTASVTLGADLRRCRRPAQRPRAPSR